MASSAPQKLKKIDLSEYAEEVIPFDVVIKRLGKVKPASAPKTKSNFAVWNRKPK